MFECIVEKDIEVARTGVTAPVLHHLPLASLLTHSLDWCPCDRYIPFSKQRWQCRTIERKTLADSA